MSKLNQYLEIVTGAGFGPGGSPSRGAQSKTVQKYICLSCGKRSKFQDDEIHNVCPKCKSDQLEKE